MNQTLKNWANVSKGAPLESMNAGIYITTARNAGACFDDGIMYIHLKSKYSQIYIGAASNGFDFNIELNEGYFDVEKNLGKIIKIDMFDGEILRKYKNSSFESLEEICKEDQQTISRIIHIYFDNGSVSIENSGDNLIVLESDKEVDLQMEMSR